MQTPLTPNVGPLDRILRALFGVVLVAAPFFAGDALFGSTIVAALSVIAGLAMLAVAATRVCPVYTLFGLKTCRSA